MTRYRAWAAPTLFTLALAGCEVGPDYKGPPREIIDRSSVAGVLSGPDDRVVAQNPLPEHWWRLYQDSRLNSLVEEGLAANIDLRVADAHIRQAVAVALEAQASRTPTTTLSGGFEYGKYGIPTPSSASFAYSIAGSLSYPVDLFGGIRRGIEAARYNAEAATAARDTVRVTVAAGVTRSYLTVCSANRTYAATVGVVEVQRRTQESVERLFRGGRATAFDVSRARAATEQSAASLPAILANRQTALFQLAALLGEPPQEFPSDIESCSSPPPLDQPLPVGDGAALIRRRPDIRQAERSLAAATATIGVDVARLYPDIVLGASSRSLAPLSLAATPDSLSFGIGPLISWTFPNQKAVRAEIQGAGAAADAAAATFDATVIEALRQTDTALSSYSRTADTVAALEKARDSARLAYNQADRLFAFGRTDFLSLLTTEAALANSETALAQAKATLVDDQVALFLALGGGWEP
jgi:NodT family efflux transporter outer membrane factor (OMF) lipoprotein